MPDTMVPPTPRSNAKRAFAILLVIVLILGVLAYAAHTRGLFLRASDTLALRGVRVLEGAYQSRTLQEFGLNGTHTVALSVPGLVSDYARAGGVEAAIVATATSSQDVYLLGAPSKKLTSTGGTKSALAISSDGKTIAFASRTGTAQAASSTKLFPTHTTFASSTPASALATPTADREGAIVDFYALDTWNVSTVDVATGSTTVYGLGSGPQLFARGGTEYLLYTTSKGLMLVNLATGVRSLTPMSVAYDARTPAIVSPEGQYLALFSLNGYALFTIANLAPLALAPVKVPLPVHAYSFAFDGSRIYLAITQPSGAQALVTADLASLADARRIETLPTYAYRIIP